MTTFSAFQANPDYPETPLKLSSRQIANIGLVAKGLGIQGTLSGATRVDVSGLIQGTLRNTEFSLYFTGVNGGGPQRIDLSTTDEPGRPTTRRLKVNSMRQDGKIEQSVYTLNRPGQLDGQDDYVGGRHIRQEALSPERVAQIDKSFKAFSAQLVPGTQTAPSP